MKHVIGIDIGGTAIKYAVFDQAAQIRFHDTVPTPQGQAPDRIPAAIADLMTGLLARFEGVEGVGISTAGVVDPVSGEIVYAGPTIPGYQGTNLKRMIQERWHLPAVIANDVNAAARGEKWRGAARDCEHFFCITLGTGIGGALYSEGQLVLGQHFRAGEIGHALYEKSTRTTYEQRASMKALMDQVAQVLPAFAGNGPALFAAAREGDAACNRLIDSWVEEIARGLAQIIVILDPALILIGGGVSEQQAFLLDKIKMKLEDNLPPSFAQTELRTAALGNRAALYGAVYPYYYENETE